MDSMMKPSLFRLVPYKTCYHYTNLLATGQKLTGKRKSHRKFSQAGGLAQFLSAFTSPLSTKLLNKLRFCPFLLLFVTRIRNTICLSLLLCLCYLDE